MGSEEPVEVILRSVRVARFAAGGNECIDESASGAVLGIFESNCKEVEDLEITQGKSMKL